MTGTTWSVALSEHFSTAKTVLVDVLPVDLPVDLRGYFR